MQDVNTDMQESEKKAQAIEWRRAKVLRYSSMGYDQREIAKYLQIHESTISRDMEYLRGESREVLQEYITKKLPDEVRKSFIAMDLILKEAWHTVKNTEDDKTRLNALNLINTVMATRLQLLGNTDVVDKVITLVTDIKDKQKKTEQQQQGEEDDTEGEEDDITTKEITNTNESE